MLEASKYSTGKSYWRIKKVKNGEKKQNAAESGIHIMDWDVVEEDIEEEIVEEVEETIPPLVEENVVEVKKEQNIKNNNNNNNNNNRNNNNKNIRHK